MILKSPDDSLFKDKVLRSATFLFFKSKFKYLVMLMVLALVAIASIKYGRDLQKRGAYGNFQLFAGNVMKTKAKIPVNYVKGLMSKPENLDISIKHIDFQKLAYYAEQAEEIGYIASHLKEEDIPAELEYQGKKYKIKLRLKGLELKHLQPDKWSLKINIKGDDTILGLNEFAIQAPQTRSYINEWIYHKFLNHENLLNLKTDFVNVTLNGKDLGVFNLEESFSKTVLERNKRREGLIFRTINGNVDVYEANKIAEKGLAHGKHIGLVSRMTNDFMNGYLSTSEVFDVEKTARYFMVSDLFGAIHGHLELNFPIYFNPINQKFEPIGYDGNAGMVFYEGSNGIAGSWHGTWTAGDRLLSKRIFSDTVFYQRYVAHLEMLDEEYYQNILDSLAEDLNNKLNILYKSYPEYYFSTAFMEENLKTIRKTLSPDNKIQNAVYHKIKNQDKLQITFNNISNVPLRMEGIYLKGQRLDIKNGNDIILYPHLRNEENTEIVYYNIADDLNIPDSLIHRLDLKYSVLGASNSGTVQLKKIFSDEIVYPDDYLTGSISSLSRFDFIEIDEENKVIRVDGGEHIIAESLIIPAGYRFDIDQATQLDLVKGGKIVSHSPVNLTGSDEFPIRIFSSDTTAQGFTVLQAGQRSIVDHVIFENMSNPTINSWSLSGAVNFYESPVTITNTVFDTNHSEDMLNVIQANFELRNSTIKNTFSDAFDGDFVKGSIINTNFENSGNDAIDVSGSSLVVQNVSIILAGDKGLSAGENSHINASKIKVKNAEIAVASKDQSHIEIDGIDIDESTIGFTCFQKKPEFGFASVRAINVVLGKVELPFLLEENSSLEVNNEVIPPSRENVNDILYGVEYGKKTIR